MSGTTLHEQKYFEFYGFIIKSIKSNFKSQRIVSPTKIYYNLKQKIIALLKDIDNIYKKYPRPILITTNNIQSAELLYNILTDYYENQSITFNLITAKNIDEDYLKIQEIGIKNHITISTQIAGRGIDIPIEKEVEETGGLHVMLFEVNNGFRIDEQLIGRTGRQGKKGSVQFYYALDDPLLIHYLNKKLKNIFLSLNLKEEDIIENKLIAKQIKKTQAEQEQIEYSMFERIALFDLTLDEARNSIFNLINENKNCKNYNELFVKILKNVLVLEAKDNLVLLKSIGLIFDDVDETNYFKKEDIILQNISNFFIAKLDEKDSKSIIHNQIIMWYIQFLKGTDSVQDGIFWRTKANKDPLVEFKKEVFNLYRNMLKNIRLSILQKTMAGKIMELIKKKLKSLKNNLKNNEKLVEIGLDFPVEIYNTLLEKSKKYNVDINVLINYYLLEKMIKEEKNKYKIKYKYIYDTVEFQDYINKNSILDKSLIINYNNIKDKFISIPYYNKNDFDKIEHYIIENKFIKLDHYIDEYLFEHYQLDIKIINTKNKKTKLFVASRIDPIDLKESVFFTISLNQNTINECYFELLNKLKNN